MEIQKPINRHDPYTQISRVWWEIENGVVNVREPTIRNMTINWLRRFAAEMPELEGQYSTNQAIAHTWRMLGTQIYYLLNPRDHSFETPCPEASYCFEQCTRYAPDDLNVPLWLRWLQPKITEETVAEFAGGRASSEGGQVNKELTAQARSITPNWYLAKSDAKHVHQLVVMLPPQAEVPPRVSNLLAGAVMNTAEWAVEALFLTTEDTSVAKEPFVFAKASNVVKMLKGYPASVAFAFYRLDNGGIFQLFVQVDSPKVRAKVGYPYLAEHSRWPEDEMDCRLVEALISCDRLEVCFVAPGENGPCTGYFGLRVGLPEEVRKVLEQEWNDLIAYHRRLPKRNYQAALGQYNIENPMEDTAVLLPQLKSQLFEGVTVKKAQAAALSGIAPERFFDLAVTRKVQDGTAEGEGKTVNAAVEAAKECIPSEAFNTRSPEVVQEGQEGVVDIQAQTEVEAQAQWTNKAPAGATLEALNCQVTPKEGFLGIGKKPGVWRAQWAKPFRVRISYKFPAQVTVRYME